MEYVGINHAAASGRKQYFPSRRIIFEAAVFHVKKLNCLMPMPRHIMPCIFVKFCPGSDIGKIIFKIRKHFFLASGIKFNALNIFYV